MALKVNATLIFDTYVITDLGIEMTFRSPDPGPGQESYYVIVLTDAELAVITTQGQLATLVRTKLERKFRKIGIAAKLDPFVGQSLVI